jgi:hypothetical protein
MAGLPSVLDMVRSEIAVMVEVFERDGDASAAWRAFSLGRKYGCEIPDSIDKEIDRFAEVVGAVADLAFQGDNKATISNEEVGLVWKNFKDRDAGPAVFRARRDYDIAVDAARLRLAGFSATHVTDVVTKRHGVSKTTLYNAQKRFPDIQYMSQAELDGHPYHRDG